MKSHEIENKHKSQRLLKNALESVELHSNEQYFKNDKIYLNERKTSVSSECGGCSSCQILLRKILSQLCLLTKKMLDDHQDEEKEIDSKVNFYR
jgi:hypothetical protein